MKTYFSGSTYSGKTADRPIWKKYIQLLLVLLTLTASYTEAQETDKSQKAKPTAVIDLFKQIQKTIGYRFFYNDEIQGLDKEVNIDIKRKEIQEIIDELKQQTNLNFRILENNLIVVVPGGEAEAIEVKGKVLSQSDKTNLTGVNVFIKGTTQGTITDADGNYSLKVSNKYDVMVYSFIGYEQQEVPINGRNTIDVTLVEDVSTLREVVITALNISRDKKSLGYSVTQLDNEEINTAKENNPINSLAGKVSGLQITKAPTGVDGSSRVILRGVASITGNNRPLFVIDGIPMDAGYGGGGRWGGTDGGDALSDLNPEDIETMSVLKGAGASAIYGSRGANGVILITTKTGTKRKGIGVSFSSGYTIETPMVTPDFQNKYGQGAYGMYPPLSGEPGAPNKEYPWIWSYGPKMEEQPLNDWTGTEQPFNSQGNTYDSFFRTGSTFTNTIALEGGGEEASFRSSITNQDSKGIMPNNNLSRQTMNLRGVAKLGEKIDFDGKITYIHSKVENRPYLAEDGANVVQTLNIMPRNISLASLQNNIADENGNELKWCNDNTFSNPYWILENLRNEDEKHRLQTMLSIKWNIASHWSLLVRSGFDFYNKNTKSIEEPGRPSIIAGTGSMSQSMGNGIEMNSDFLLNFDKKYENFKFNISAGGNHRYNQGKSISQRGGVMRIPNFYNIKNYKNYNTSEWLYEKAVYSAYGLATISFKNYLYFDVTARNDWSSTLPLQNNSYFYHSENISFLFTEAFGLKNNILNSGKIRASYAKVGNDTGAYQINQYYGISQTQTPYPMASIGGQIPHFDLQPEETYSWEVGANLSLLSNKVELDFTYYYSLSDKQIMGVDLAPSTGYATKFMNAGKIQNKGIEAQINASPISSNSGFNWNIVLTWSRNKNMVKELYEDLDYLPLADEFHMTMEAHINQPYGVIYTTDYKRDAFGNKLIDKNGYAQAGEKTAMGDINPDWMAGLSNQFSYKNLSMSFLIDMQMGGDIYSWGKAYRGLFGTSIETLQGREEWIAGTGGFIEAGINETNGQPNTTPIAPSMRWYNIYANQIGTEWMQDATNVRLRELTLSYSLPKKWLRSTPITNLNISLVGRNIFFIYRAMDHVDPESGYSSGNTGSGIEHLSLPSTSSYGVNLKLNF